MLTSLAGMVNEYTPSAFAVRSVSPTLTETIFLFVFLRVTLNVISFPETELVALKSVISKSSLVGTLIVCGTGFSFKDT